MPQNILITDEDVQEISREFKCDFSDDSRRQALLRTTNMDVQACPGSGKTTLLVAKLAILAKKWRWRDRGILVLSHTNIARKEVERLLAKHAYGHKLLSYPHYIGTIQSFVDGFLALPLLKSQGLETFRIDDGAFAKAAASHAKAREREFLWFHKRQYQGIEFLQNARFEYLQGKLNVGCADRNFILGRDTDSFSAMSKMKTKLAREGFFRFDDMFAMAEKYVFDYPWVLQGLRSRFAWVFIDEMQDTTDTADSLLNHLFWGGCIYQRFGDGNQAIFHGEGNEKPQSSFPKKEICIDLPKSKRFSCLIAHLASPLSAIHPQTLEGNSERSNLQNTIFLLDNDSVSSVLPAFGAVIREQFGQTLPRDFTAKAVGSRKSPRKAPVDIDKYLPHDVGDYWSDFDYRFTNKSGGENRLLEFMTKAWSFCNKTGEFKEGYSLVIEGLVRSAEELGLVDGENKRISKAVLLQKVLASSNKTRRRFDSLMIDLCMNSARLTNNVWVSIIKAVSEILMELFPNQNPKRLSVFFEFEDHFATPAKSENSNHINRRNIYRYEVDGFSCDIEVATIHSIKGETHNATLVLETYFNKNHDLKKTIPFLFEATNNCESADENTKEHLKRIYVAMTRPQSLLCLAFRKDHLSASSKATKITLEKLEAKGWRIDDLTAANRPKV